MNLWFNALAGGALIGIAAVFTMLALGRMTGISGIARGLVFGGAERAWRASFVLGLVCSAPAYAFVIGRSGIGTSAANLATLAVAGVLVGVGTAVGGGCTSGHGVCGIARLSKRSIAATLIFVLAAMATVAIARHSLAAAP
ncbi:MAG: YeeE/YedE family protein [Rudaea sp.]